MESANKMISVSRQCELLGLNRSSYYYRPERDDSYNEYLMWLIDEQYTRTPFFGVPKMLARLQRQGHWVNINKDKTADAALCHLSQASA